MKIRTGFVSNSSASSFCIYGIFLEQYEMKEILAKKFNIDLEKMEEDEEEIDTFIEKYLKDNKIKNFSYGTFYQGENYYLGRTFDSIGDNETGKQMKESVEKVIKDLSEDLECDFYEEAEGM